MKVFVLGMHFSRPINMLQHMKFLVNFLTYVSIKIGQGDIQKCKTWFKKSWKG
jgi:hypothetical protein